MLNGEKGIFKRIHEIWYPSYTILSSRYYYMCVSCSVVFDSETPRTVAHQASLSMGFSRQRILEWIAIPFSRGTSQPKD